MSNGVKTSLNTKVVPNLLQPFSYYVVRVFARQNTLIICYKCYIIAILNNKCYFLHYWLPVVPFKNSSINTRAI